MVRRKIQAHNVLQAASGRDTFRAARMIADCGMDCGLRIAD